MKPAFVAAVVLSLFLVSISRASGDDAGLRCVVEAEKPEYAVGEPIYVRAQLENVSDEQVQIMIRYGGPEGPAWAATRSCWSKGDLRDTPLPVRGTPGRLSVSIRPICISSSLMVDRSGSPGG